MPNQWVRVTERTATNYGKVCAVEPGMPVEKQSRCIWTGREYVEPGYIVTHAGNLSFGPLYDPNKLKFIPSEFVELLGPDECARLDKEYGLAP